MTQNVSIPQRAKCFNTPNLYTTDMHFYNSLINIGSITFFSSSYMHQSHHLSRCHATGIKSSLNSFLNSCGFVNLICQAKSLIRIIVSGSSSSNLSSKLMLLRSILRMPIPLQLNMASPEPSLK